MQMYRTKVSRRKWKAYW